MDKDKIINILEYYIRENIEYLYYEKRMYPVWINRNELIARIARDICEVINTDMEIPISSKITSREPDKEKLEKMVKCSSCEHCKIIQPSFDDPYITIYCSKNHWEGPNVSDLSDLIICEDFKKIYPKCIGDSN
jgi:hypothetical protein